MNTDNWWTSINFRSIAITIVVIMIKNETEKVLGIMNLSMGLELRGSGCEVSHPMSSSKNEQCPPDHTMTEAIYFLLIIRSLLKNVSICCCSRTWVLPSFELPDQVTTRRWWSSWRRTGWTSTPVTWYVSSLYPFHGRFHSSGNYQSLTDSLVYLVSVRHCSRPWWVMGIGWTPLVLMAMHIAR